MCKTLYNHHNKQEHLHDRNFKPTEPVQPPGPASFQRRRAGGSVPSPRQSLQLKNVTLLTSNKSMMTNEEKNLMIALQYSNKKI